MKTYNERAARVMEKAELGKRKRNRQITCASVAACAAAVLLACNLVLFVPYELTIGAPDISKYEGSEYYSVIEKLSGLTYSYSHTTNNFHEWFGGFYTPKGETSEPSVSPDYAGEDENYNEVTDNQTAGVVEGDLFKRSDKYIYYLDYESPYTYSISGGTRFEPVYRIAARYVLSVYSVAGADSEKVAEYYVEPEDGMSFSGYASRREMYLSENCDTVTVVTPCYHAESGTLYTAVIGIDVSDPENIKEVNRSYVSGQYVSSRVADGSLLMISNFNVRWHPDFSDEAQFVPQTGGDDGMTSVPMEDIVLPDVLTSTSYTVISELDASSFEVTDCVAFLSYSDEAYVSAENVFVTRDYFEADETGGFYEATEIVCVGYGDGLEKKGSFEVAGTVKNRYCMDERDDVLRVFTSTMRYSVQGNTVKSANLYCVDLNTFESVAVVQEFAPQGESVQSARFYGDTAYVCTAVTYVVPTDPVFAFDLSDYDNITYKDTGTIPGYSLSLVSFKDGTLLGIGYGESRELKIEVYRETDSSLESVAKKELFASFSENYKAYFIDAERGLIGLGIVEGEFAGYLLLRFDGYELMELARTPLGGISDYMRACYIDEYLYMFGTKSFGITRV